MSSDQQQEHSYGWFLLLDSATGEPYKGASATKVAVSSSAYVADLRKAVKAKHSNKLSSFAASQLRVYKNKSAFDKRNHAEGEGKEEPMDPTECIGLLGSIEDMLVVAVPSSISSSQSTSESSFTGKQPHPKRLERWIKLNEILERNAQQSNTNDSTENSEQTWNQVESVYKEPHPKRKERWIKLNEILERNAQQSEHNDSTENSNLTWNQVESVFNPKNYVQKRREMDEGKLICLAEYLSFPSKCFTFITPGKDANRLHFICPILFCVCSLFDGDVDIVVEEDLVGTFVKAQGHFEFMLRRKNKAVCIIVAKKDDFEQGIVQDLVGCEVAAEVKGLGVVYGIVTNYIRWVFLCSRNDMVEMEEYVVVGHTPEGPEEDPLKNVAEKIYAMLSD